MGAGGLGGGDIDVAGGGADGEICGRLAASTFSASCTGNTEGKKKSYQKTRSASFKVCYHVLKTKPMQVG